MKKRSKGPLDEVARAIVKGAVAQRRLSSTKLGREMYGAMEAVTIAESRLEVARQTGKGQVRIRETLQVAKSDYRMLLRGLPNRERRALEDYLEWRELAFAGLSSFIDGNEKKRGRTRRYRQPR
jgi:hypothetical protein